MSITSFSFILFLISSFVMYYIFPKKYRWISLTVFSVGFSLIAGIKLSLTLFIVTAITYIYAILLKATKTQLQKKMLTGITVAASLFFLFVFKYYNFFATLSTRFFSLFHLPIIIPQFTILLPLGISFYTFKSIGYVIDCYRGKIEPERNFFKYLLFVSFFPEISSGPISRSTSLLVQIREAKSFDINGFKNALVTLLIGFFEKIVIADRLAIIANTVFNEPSKFHGFATIIGILSFSAQIYCDFLACSTIAVGCAKMFGFNIINNFDTPYLSKSIKEFWRRWHISLSSWFRDYLYIPLGGNRKGEFRKNLNVVIVFLLSGLWHGAGIGFVIWGLLHGLYQVISNVTDKARKNIRLKLKINETSKIYGCFCTLFTFLIVTFAWIFFRADGIENITQILKNLTDWKLSYIFERSQYWFGLDIKNFILAFVLVLIMFVANIISRRINIIDRISKKGLVTLCSFTVIILILITVLGIYGPGYDAQQFIYAQF